MSDNIKLSVIVPIYNSAPFIERCVESLMNQTLDSIEYIFIDDGSIDDSMELVQSVVEKFPNRQRYVKLVYHDINQGVSSTRADGLKVAKGRFVIFCDSDDWVDLGLYESMYMAALENEAEIISCPYVIEDGINGYFCLLPYWPDRDSFLKHPKWELLSTWMHMIKRDFLILNNLNFLKDVDYSEDYGLIFRCYFYSKKNIQYAGPSAYHYNKLNSSSLTIDGFTLKKLEHKTRCLDYLSQFLEARGYDSGNVQSLQQEKRAVKEGYLMNDRPYFSLWRQTFPEITRIVLRDKNLSIPYRIAWALGQYIHPILFKLYFNVR